MVLCIFININIFQCIQIAPLYIIEFIYIFLSKEIMSVKQRNRPTSGPIWSDFINQVNYDFGEIMDPKAAYQYPD